MRSRPLGDTGIDVSVICLGTMTWGEQNTREEGFAQMDHALAHGINFFDTAEMYPCLLYTSPSPRDLSTSRMPSSA